MSNINTVSRTKPVDLNLIRWIMYTKQGKSIVENHAHGRTWKKVYKDNFKNIEAVCFQIIPLSKKVFISSSPYEEYWTSEEMVVQAGSSYTEHVSRTLASKQDIDIQNSETIWDTVTIYGDGSMKYGTMTGSEIGYESLEFVNKEEKHWV